MKNEQGSVDLKLPFQQETYHVTAASFSIFSAQLPQISMDPSSKEA